MVSVRGSLDFRGDLPFSLRALAQLERRDLPVSVRSLIDIQSQSWSVPVSSGDVTVNVTFSIRNIGDWSARISAHDHGTIAGDNFVLDLELVGTPERVGTRFDASLDLGSTLELENHGVDPAVRTHYYQITGIRANLKVVPHIGEIITGAFTALLVAIAGIFVSQSGPSIEMVPCPDDAPFQDDQKKCVQLRRGASGGGSETPSPGSG
ncbi:hypothetical protein [Pseudofrankia sp. DC12]|uniref:hypothetical protein n=1 Tax=Pseudofrankia sp. DC12 TaxID=683315 RepID=UPI0005F846CA|nr:hypothetical protein [Pseudofrankia sp. DC12]